MAFTKHDLTSEGILFSNQSVLTMVANDQRIYLDNVQDLSVHYPVASQDYNMMGFTTTQHFPGMGSIEGQMTIHTTHAIWNDLAMYHQKKRVFPWVDIKMTSPAGGIMPTSRNGTVTSSTNDPGTISITLVQVMFKDIPLYSYNGSSNEDAMIGTVEFVANKFESTNKLRGHGILDLTDLRRLSQ